MVFRGKYVRWASPESQWISSRLRSKRDMPGQWQAIHLADGIKQVLLENFGEEQFELSKKRLDFILFIFNPILYRDIYTTFSISLDASV